jgi:hypothetical protein
MKWLFKNRNRLITISILIFIGLALYFSRQIFFYKYEPEYYENWYYHSQWNIPNSVRGIGDGDLYKFVGYRLAFGENPFNINYEVPPFAKLLYGLAERFLSNPYIISIILYFLSIILVYQTAKLFFTNNSYLSLLTTLLFTTSPFFSTQVRETMLDLPLMFFFNLHFYFFILFLKKQKINSLIISGFFLGIATGCKIGVYSPLIFIIELAFIFSSKRQKIKQFFLYGFSTFLGYVFSFISYFAKHPNPIPWLRLHEKPFKFYLMQGSGSKIDHFNQIKGIIFNKYQGFWEGAQPGSLGDWSPMISVGFILLITLLITSIKSKNKTNQYLSVFTLSFIIINCFIPFFPRYLMPIIPMLCLIIVIFFQSKTIFIYILIVLNIPFFYNSVIKQPYQGTIDSTVRFINTRNYRELYRAITQQQRKDINEDYFINSYENFLNQIGVRKIEAEITNLDKQSESVSGKLHISYQSRYGHLKNSTDIKFKKINNQWKLVWNWDYLYNTYNPENQIQVIPKGNIFITEALMIPRLMFDWGLNLTQIQDITSINQKIINERIRFTVPDKYPRWVGDIISPKFNIATVNTIPGLSFSKEPSRADIYFINNQQEKIVLF